MSSHSSPCRRPEWPSSTARLIRRPRSKRSRRQIADELAEIDRLLLETGANSKARDAGEAMERTVRRMDELLQQTIESQGNAVDQIDELIKELEKLPGGLKRVVPIALVRGHGKSISQATSPLAAP